MFRSLDHPQEHILFLAKVSVETINTLLYVSVMQQHVLCMCICGIPCREFNLMFFLTVHHELTLY